jgi:hypothetical protein
VRNLSVAVDRTIATLNLDMVGRARVSGITADWLEEEFQATVAATRQLRIRRGGTGAGRSDDSSFIDRPVPAINFFTGFHHDYHRPTDDWEKVDVVGTAQVASAPPASSPRAWHRATGEP